MTTRTRRTRTGHLFPHEPVNFVHRKWTVSQEISQNISNVLTYLTYFYHFVDEISLEFQQIRTFQLYKAANFYKIPQEIWSTLSRFTGRQEKKDALIRPIHTKGTFYTKRALCSKRALYTKISLCTKKYWH